MAASRAEINVVFFFSHSILDSCQKKLFISKDLHGIDVINQGMLIAFRSLLELTCLEDWMTLASGRKSWHRRHTKYWSIDEIHYNTCSDIFLHILCHCHTLTSSYKRIYLRQWRDHRSSNVFSTLLFEFHHPRYPNRNLLSQLEMFFF